MQYGFGVDLGGTTVKLACFRQDGTCLSKWQIPTRTADSGSHILPDIAQSLATYMAKENIPTESVLGIGIGVPGPVLPDGTVNHCVNLGWGVFNVEQALCALTGLPVRAGNDACCAALGEYYHGSGKDCHSMVLVTLGTGVGGGIVVEGRLLGGAHGAGGEIGHAVINPNETEKCACGSRGCAEQYCSATGIVRLAKRQLQACDTPSALRASACLTCKEVFDAAAAGDSLAQAVLEQVYTHMGQLLACICAAVDPERVVIGGGVSKAGLPLLEGIGRQFRQQAFPTIAQTELSLASLGNDAGVYGAFHLLR